MIATARSQPLVYIVAGEVSGDALGAALIRSLRLRTSGAIAVAGVGGPMMAEEGVASPFPIEDLSIVGFGGIAAKLPLILRRIREASDGAIASRADALVIIDSPEFTHRVARRVRKRLRAMPIIDYVSPSIWAWRPWRARAMRAYVDHVLALLPFEPEAHRRLGGPPCTFVGHPLGEAVGTLRPSAAEAARRVTSPPLVLALPGSRRGELARHSEIFGEALGRVARDRPIDLVVPTLPHLADEVARRTAAWPVRPRIVTEKSERDAAFRQARAALAASGTVTLELALSGVPTVAAYRVARFEAFVARRMIQVPSVILANLVLGENIVPEFLQEDCTPDRLAQALKALIADGPARDRQLAAFRRLDAILELGAEPPSLRAADVVLSLINTRQAAA